MQTRLSILLLALLATTIAPQAAGQQTAVQFSSGLQRVTLLELYTSEGCNSCPPADAWLSELKKDPRLWQAFVPMALHVDYWDYIGWRDRFATSDYSARQKRYAEEGGARFVYTPGFFMNGDDWSGWRYRENIKRQTMNVGNLTVSLNGNRLLARFSPTSTTAEPLTLNVALLGMNLETRVKAGENHGRVLRHDFVALGMSTAPLEIADDDYSATIDLPDVSQHAEDLALVAWVSAAGSQAPIQSVGGYLP